MPAPAAFDTPHANNGASTALAARAHAAAQADLDAERREYLFSPPAWLASRLIGLLDNEKDAPIMWLMFDICTTVLPCSIALYAGRCRSHLIGAAYFACTYVVFLQRFLLGLHCLEHRRLLRGGFNWVPSILLAPLFGVPSGCYNLHHAVMHHVEGNAAHVDLSSTESYQRDNFLHFIMYWLRHGVLSCVELPLYALRKGRHLLAAKCIATEVAYYTLVASLWRLNHVATTWVFLVPFVVSSFALMFGNWSQHIFINPMAPRDSYGMTYTCVNAADNLRTFNDGYHVQHHLNSKLHWMQLPAHFQTTLSRHADHQALVFEGLGWFDVGLAVFCRRWHVLLKHFVAHSDRFASMSESEIVALLQSRLKPIRLRR